MQNRARYVSMTIAFVVSLTASNAQVSIEEFILSAKSDFDFRSYEQRVNYLDAKQYRLSPLQKTEFRTKSNQLDASRQDYAVRITPANPWEIRNNSNYFSQYKSVLSHEKNLALKDALITRYNLIISLLFYQETLKLKEENKKLIDMQIAILERQRNSEYFKGEDYLELKLDQMDRTVEAEEAAFELGNHQLEMAGVYPALVKEQIAWQDVNIIPVTKIIQVMDSLETTHSTPATLLYRESQIALAVQEYKLEKSNVNFGFIQTEYEHYRLEQDRKPWSISAGITVPLTNPNKGDMAKRKLDIIEAEYDRDETKGKLEVEQNVSLATLKSLFTRYNNIHDKIESLNVSGLSKTLSALQDDNPMAIVRFRENLLKLRSIEVKLKQRIMTNYVELLGLTDAIQQTPLINFLSADLKVLSTLN